MELTRLLQAVGHEAYGEELSDAAQLEKISAELYETVNKLLDSKTGTSC